MNDEPASTRCLKQRWDEKDAARDKQEERAQQAFLEAEANHTFAPIEDFLIRLSKVLSAGGASVEIDTTWQHLGERRLRRVAKVISPNRRQIQFGAHGKLPKIDEALIIAARRLGTRNALLFTKWRNLMLI